MESKHLKAGGKAKVDVSVSLDQTNRPDSTGPTVSFHFPVKAPGCFMCAI